MMTLNFSTICRTCMTQSKGLMCIFNTENNSKSDNIVSMLASITSIQASIDDGLPENICLACLSEINRAFSFKIRSERSEHTLKQYFIQLNSKTTIANESNLIIDSLNSIVIDDEVIEIVDVEEHDQNHLDYDLTQQNVLDSELTEMYDNDHQNKDENSKTIQPIELPNTVSVVYECHICYDTFDSISLSEKHMEITHHSVQDAEFQMVKCSICSLDFDNADYLDAHFTEKHQKMIDIKNEDDNLSKVVKTNETNITFQEECDDENYNEVILTDEVTENDQIASVIVLNTSESNELELKYNCNKCGGKFAKERSLNIHTKLNKCTIKSFECKICKKVFVRKRNLNNHMQTHRESNNLSCKICSETFTQADKLARHVQSEHEPTRKYLCPHCWKSFNVSSSLKDHLRTHNGEKPYLCSICGKGFSQSTNLNQHVMRHNKTKPYSCSICLYSFVSKGELEAHSRKHSGLHPFICEICSASFTTSSSLVKHTRIHTGERPYACKYCPMRFAALGTLKNHTRTHNGARPFGCGVCGRTFSQRSDCLSHQDTHSSEKSFFCKQCYKSFHKKSGLRNHMKTHSKDGLSHQLINTTAVTTETDDDVNNFAKTTMKKNFRVHHNQRTSDKRKA